MNIPKKIIEQGGEILETYVRANVELNKAVDKVCKIEQDITELFTNIQRSIGDYLPREDNYRNGRYLSEVIYDSRHVIPALRSKNPIESIYEVEEYLKEVRELSLQARLAEKKRDELETKIYKMRK